MWIVHIVAFLVQLVLFLHKVVEWLVLYMTSLQPVFDILYPLTLVLVTKAFKLCIVWLYHRDRDQFHSIAGSGDNEAFPLIRI